MAYFINATSPTPECPQCNSQLIKKEAHHNSTLNSISIDAYCIDCAYKFKLIYRMHGYGISQLLDNQNNQVEDTNQPARELV